MRFHNKRTVAVAAALTLALGGGVAYAYWTTTGSGTATATVGTDANLVVTQTGSVTGLYPGGPSQPVSFTVNNPNGADELITSAVIAIGSITSVGTCTAADFTVTSPVVNQTITGGNTVTINGGSIAMNETGVDQNGCKNATVNLTINVS